MSADTQGPDAAVDPSQARLLERLRAAGGGPVSFAELRSLGIENPAVLAYELDLVGMPIERVHHYDAPGRAVPVGVRIEESDRATAPLKRSAPLGHLAQQQLSRWRRRARKASEPLWERLRVASAAGSIAARAIPSLIIAVRSIAVRIIAVRSVALWSVALRSIAVRSIAVRSIAARASQGRAFAAPIALVVVAAAIALLTLTSRGDRRVNAAAARTRIGTQTVLRTTARPGTSKAPRPVGGAPAPRQTSLPSPPAAVGAPGTVSAGASTRDTGASAATSVDRPPASSNPMDRPPEHARAAGASSSAAQLQAEGHQLLIDRRYAAAIGDLRSAVAISGQSIASCGAPTSEACLTYAYALYDLGHALRMSGDPGAAVGVLSERLRIDNQRATVQEELDRARAAASAGGVAAPKPPPAQALAGGTRAPGDARHGRHHGRDARHGRDGRSDGLHAP